MITPQSSFCLRIALFTSLLLAFATSCKRSPTSGLQGQSNVTMTFYGKAVDQDGAPLSGVAFQFQLEAYPKNWSFETAARPKDVTTMNAVSDANGLFQLSLTGSFLRMIKAEPPRDYRQLEELDSSTSAANAGNSVFTRAISLVEWGDQKYRSDAERPAVYVFVKDGAHRATTLPTQGGFRHPFVGREWTENKPAWPFQPSLADVDWAEGQARVNVDIPLVLQAVDGDGRPLANVNIYMDVERYRTLEEMKSDHYQPMQRTSPERLSATTGPDGLARATAHGFRFGGIYHAQLAGETYGGGPQLLGVGRPNYYARELMDKDGNAISRFDEENPMVLVFLQPGATESRVMPSRGGFELREGQWQRVEPTWPTNAAPALRYRSAEAKNPSSQPK